MFIFANCFNNNETIYTNLKPDATNEKNRNFFNPFDLYVFAPALWTKHTD